MNRAVLSFACFAAIALAGEGRAADGAPTPGTVQRKVEDGLSRSLGGTVRFATFDVDWLRLEARFGDARVDVSTPSGQRASAWVESGRLRLSWAALPGLLAGTVRISEIEMVGPTIRASSDFLREWKPGKGGDGGMEVRLDRVRVTRGEVEWEDAASGTSVRAAGVAGSGAWSSSRKALVGEFRTESVVRREGLGEGLAVSARATILFRTGTLEFPSVRLEAPGARLEGNASATFGDEGASWSARAEFRADAALVRQWFPAGGPAVSGGVRGSIRAKRRAGESRWEVLGTARADSGRVATVEIADLRTAFRFVDGGVAFRDLQGKTLGGTVRGTADLTFGKDREFRMNATLRGADGALLAEAIHRPLPLGSEVDADVWWTMPVGRGFESWTGEVRFSAAAAPTPNRIRVAGEGLLRLEGGRLTGNGLSLRAASASASVAIDLPLAKGLAPGVVRFQGVTERAGATHAAVLRIADTLRMSLPDWLRQEVRGHGALEGGLTVPGVDQAATWDLRLDLEDAAWAGESFDRATVEVYRRESLLDIPRAELRRGVEALHGSARFSLTPFELVRLDAQAAGVRTGPILSRWPALAGIDSYLSAEIAIERSASGLEGGGRFSLDGGTLWGEPLERARGRCVASGGEWELADGTVEAPLLSAEVAGSFDPVREEAKGTVALRDLRPGASSRFAGSAVRLDGVWSGEGTWEWSRAGGPRAALRVEGSSLAAGTQEGPTPLGEAVGTLDLKEGALTLDLEERGRAAWRLRAAVSTSGALPFEATMVFHRFAAPLPRTGEEVSLDLSGSVQARGSLSQLAEAEIDGRFEGVDLYVPGGRFQALGPVPLSLAARRLRIGPAQLGTKGAKLDGFVDWNTADGDVVGTFRGAADLSLLSLVRKDLRGSGRLDVDVRLAGTLAAPELEGRATLSDGRMRWIGVRQTLDEVQAEMTFDGRSARLKTFRALSGGGELDGAGFLELGPDGTPRFDVTMGVSQVGVVFPEGFRGIYDGALRLEGTFTASTLAGRLALVRGLYDRDLEFGALAADASREVERTLLAELPRGVYLDVEIEGSDDVWMRNNMGRLEAGVSLRVGGEIRDPRLTGRILLYEGGRLRFRDVNYRLLSGSLEFEGSETVDPFVELRAETRVGDYDIRLRIAGRLDSFSYELSSYPPLPESDIIALLLTGQIPAASSGAAASGASTAPGGLAADYFAGVLTSGFARQVEKTLRLDQFRINPLLESGSDPTARVTLGKQVTDRLRLLYSVDVGGAGDDRYFVEWEASRRWRLTAESDTNGVYVGSAQFTDRYGREGAREALAGSERTRESLLLEAIEIRGTDPDEAVRLRRAADLEPGTTVRRSAVFQAAETVRRDLAEEGWIDARVGVEIAAEASPPGESDAVPARVVFQVERGLRTAWTLEGLDGRLERGVRKSVEEWLLEGIAGPDLAEEVSEVVLEELQVRGHYAADVVVRVEVRGEEGRTLRVVVDPGPVIRASAILLEGVSQIPEERVRRQILTGRTEGLKSRPISPAVLEEDARAIATLYRSEGFLDATVEPPQVRLAIDGERGEVRFIVHEGARFAIHDVTSTIEGPVMADEVVAWTGLAPGRPVSAASLAEATSKVRTRLDAMGFAEARIEVSPEREEDRVTVVVSGTTGPRMLYAGAVVEGNFRTRDKVVLRESPCTPGEPISASALREFQHRLYRLGVFRSVRIVPERAEEAGPDAYRLRVAVEEAKPLGVNVGGGYDTEAGPQVSFGAGHDNLWGFNRSLSFQTRWSSLERRVQVVGRDPWLFGREWDTTATYFWESLEEEGFDLRRNSVAFRVQRRLQSRWTRFLRYNFQRVDIAILDPSDDVLEAILEQKLQNLRLGDVGLAFARDTRDDSFLPTRGGYALGELRVFAPAFLSERNFVKLFLQGSTTHTFPRGPAYAASVRIGAAKTYGSTEFVPLSERFFAGGTSTLRGFERDQVGLVVDGVPIGGEAMLLINQEFRWPLWRSLSLVTFTDWGNVYSRLQAFDPTDLRYTAGAGLRLGTPIGPLRFEYGRKLDRRPGESSGQFYFAVGTIY